MSLSFLTVMLPFAEIDRRKEGEKKITERCGQVAKEIMRKVQGRVNRGLKTWLGSVKGELLGTSQPATSFSLG